MKVSLNGVVCGLMVSEETWDASAILSKTHRHSGLGSQLDAIKLLTTQLSARHGYRHSCGYDENGYRYTQ
jgi:hypothetical protein